MIYHRGIPIRRIEATQNPNQYHIERTDRVGFVVSGNQIGADGGIDEIAETARISRGRVINETTRKTRDTSLNPTK